MLESFLFDKHLEINGKAEREKREASYVADLIEKEPEKFKRVFNPEGKIHESDLSKEIYRLTRYTIEKLDEEYTRCIGMSPFYFVPGQQPQEPVVLFGWGEYKLSCVSEEDIKQNPGKKMPHTLRPTKLGLKIIEDLRGILGYPSTKKHKEKNNEFLRKLSSSQARVQ